LDEKFNPYMHNYFIMFFKQMKQQIKEA